MPSLGLRTTKRPNTKDGEECVLLIEADADVAAELLAELNSETEERFHVEWVTELSRGIERLRRGGVGAGVLDLTLPDSHGVETFDKIFQAAPGVPVLILSGADAEETARRAVQRGAQDYLVKNQADGYRLRRTVHTMKHRRTSGAMLLENEVANVTLDSSGEGVLRADLHSNVTYLDRMAEEMTGWRREEALGRPMGNVLRLIDSVSGAAAGDAAEIAMHEGKAAKEMANCKNCILVRRDGLEFGIESKVTLIHDKDGSITGAVVAFHDVSAARAKSLEMSHSAQHDVLTDLPNRVLFNDRLTQAIALAERQGKQLAVMFVDLDHFKKINDSLGHGVGDKLLQSVAGRLMACVRRSDTVSRLGGDEFVVLLSQVEHEEDAAFSARKILRSLAVPHTIDSNSLDIN